MNREPLEKAASLRLWGGLYLLSYGAMIDIAYFAPRYASPFKWAYNLAIIGFAAALSWHFAKWTKPIVRFTWPLVFLLGTAALVFALFYLPWVWPTYYGNVRFGWSESANRAMESGQKLLFIVSGTCLLSSYLSSIFRGRRNSSPSPQKTVE